MFPEAPIMQHWMCDRGLNWTRTTHPAGQPALSGELRGPVPVPTSRPRNGEWTVEALRFMPVKTDIPSHTGEVLVFIGEGVSVSQPKTIYKQVPDQQNLTFKVRQPSALEHGLQKSTGTSVRGLHSSYRTVLYCTVWRVAQMPCSSIEMLY